MAKQPELKGELRKEFGKGAARRARRAGNIPAVIYGHGSDPIHVAVDNLDFMRILREEGINAVMQINADGEEHLVLVKALSQNPLSLNIEHIDFLAIKKGEKVEVEVPLIVEGEAKPGASVIIDTDVLTVMADALNIPEEFTVSIEGMEPGDSITAADVELPENVELVDEADTLLVNVTYEEIADVEPSDEDASADVETVEESEAEEDEEEEEEDDE